MIDMSKIRNDLIGTDKKVMNIIEYLEKKNIKYKTYTMEKLIFGINNIDIILNGEFSYIYSDVETTDNYEILKKSYFETSSINIKDTLL